MKHGAGGAAMSEDKGGEDPAMADILASIKRIVAEEDKRGGGTDLFNADEGGIFELTSDMRVDGDGPLENELAVDMVEATTPSIDEAAVADISRVVLREELNGQLGIALTRNIKALVREEVARVLAERQG
jgi:cell pole-organizing protein PopZ